MREDNKRQTAFQYLAELKDNMLEVGLAHVPILTLSTAFSELIKVNNEDKINEESIPTAATDGEVIYINENYMNELKETKQLSSILTIILEEKMHQLLMHHQRMGPHRDKRLWNLACDIFISKTLKDDHIHSNHLDEISNFYCEILKVSRIPKNATEETIYKELKQILSNENTRNAKKVIKRTQKSGDLLEASAEDQLEKALSELIQAERTMQKLGYSKEQEYTNELELDEKSIKQRGYDTSTTATQLFKVHESKNNLKNRIKEFLNTVENINHSFRRPNKRYLARKIILPGVVRTPISSRIVFAVDCSGSMDAEQVNKGINALQEILKTTSFKYVDFLTFNSSIIQHLVFKKGETLPEATTLRTGGGTAILSIFKYTESKDYLKLTNSQPPAGYIIVSDMEAESTNTINSWIKKHVTTKRQNVLFLFTTDSDQKNQIFKEKNMARQYAAPLKAI